MGPLVHEEHVAAVAGVCRLHSAVVGGRAASSQSFKAGMLAPRAARRFVVETLARWGCDDLAADAALVVTELATNAVIHAKSDFIVSMTCQNDVVRISVRDDSVVAPTARRSPTTTPSGRGMVLVAATGRQWEAELLPDGKVVWVEFERVGRRD
jgi:anti-sigma regulatory factor (Ser/Thr protein kinase)